MLTISLKTYFFTIAFSVLFCSTLFSQTLPANITLSDQRVLSGSLAYFSWNNMPSELTFFDAKETRTTIRNKDIQSLRITFPDGSEDLFKRFITHYDTSSKKFQYLDYDPTPRLYQDTLLLQLLYDGSKPLYRYVDRNKNKHYFIQEKDSIPSELINKHYRLPKAPIRYYINDVYRRELPIKMADCPAVGDASFRLPYEVTALVRHFKAYDACIGNTKTHDYTHPKVKKVLGIIGGAYLSKPNTRRLNGPSEPVEIKTNFSAGILGEAFLKNSLCKQSFQADIQYATFTSYFQSKDNDLTAVLGFEEKSSLIRLNAMYKYGSSYLRSYRCFVGLGGSLARYLNRDITRYLLPENGYLPYTLDIPTDSATEFGIVMAAGLQKGRIGLELRGEAIVGLLVQKGYELYPSRVGSLHLMASYRFVGPVFWR